MKRTSRRVPLLLVLAGWFLLPPQASAEDVSWRIRGTAGIQQYELDFTDVVRIPADPIAAGTTALFRDGFEVDDRLTFGGIGVTAGFGKFLIDISAQKTMEGNDNGTQFIGGFDTGGAGVGHSYTAEFDRQEINLNVAYGLSDTVTLFLGYKDAEADLTINLRPGIDDELFFLNVGDIFWVGNRATEFSYDGFQFGAAFATPIRNGALSLQAAVVMLDGEFKERFNGGFLRVTSIVPEVAEPDDFPGLRSFDVTGDALGFNLGIAWTGRFSQKLPRLTYVLGLDHSIYEFDADQTFTGNFEEKNTRLRFDLRYEF